MDQKSQQADKLVINWLMSIIQACKNHKNAYKLWSVFVGDKQHIHSYGILVGTSIIIFIIIYVYQLGTGRSAQKVEPV